MFSKYVSWKVIYLWTKHGTKLKYCHFIVEHPVQIKGQAGLLVLKKLSILLVNS